MPNGGAVPGFAYSDSRRIVGVTRPAIGLLRSATNTDGQLGNDHVHDSIPTTGRTIRYEYGGLGWLANCRPRANGDRVERRYNREDGF